MAEQADEARLQAGLRAKEDAYAAANAAKMDREERARYEMREARRRMAVERAVQAEGGGGGMATDRREAAQAAGLPGPWREDKVWDEGREGEGDMDEGL